MAEPGNEAPPQAAVERTAGGSPAATAGKLGDGVPRSGGATPAAGAPDGQPPARGRNRTTLWLVIDSALIVLIAIGAYYFFYTKTRQTYIAERNYRLLNAASRQLRTRVDGLLTIFDSAVSECGPAPSSSECLKEEDAWQCCFRHSSLRQDPTVRVGCRPKDPDSRLAITKGEKPTPGAAAASSVAYIVDSATGGEKELYITAGSSDHRLCGTVALGDLVDLTLASKMFERVLVVRGGKEVLYRIGPELTQPTEVQKLLETQWRALCPSGDGQVAAKEKDDHGDGLSTTLVAYAQLAQLTSDSCDAARDWMIVGLLPATRAFAENMAIPLGALIPATYLLLLMALAWPLVKLWQMSHLERLRAFELHVLVFAGLTATGMLTFAILSQVTETAASARLDENLKEIAQALQWRFQDEIHCVVAELHEFKERQNNPSAAVANSRSIRYYPWFANLVSVDASGQPRQTFKPAYEDERWVWKEAPNLQLKLNDRGYFRAARTPGGVDDLLWNWTIPAPPEPQRRDPAGKPGAGPDCLDDPGKAFQGKPVPFAIEPLMSRSSGTMMVVLAMRSGPDDKNRPDGTGGVNTLATRLQSLTAPVLPVGFQFAVVDRNGLVQFHADPTRNLQENLFDETNHDRGVRAAVLTRRAELMDIDYLAWPQRAYVMPLKDTPWSVIVFHKQLMSFSLSFAVAVVWLFMWGVYLAAYAMTDLIVQWIRPRAAASGRRSATPGPRYAAPWMWPDRSRRYVFTLLGLALTVWLAARCMLQDSIAESALHFAVTIALAPLVALAVVYVSSRRSERAPSDAGPESLGTGRSGFDRAFWQVLGVVVGAAAAAQLLRRNGCSWPVSLAGSTVFFLALAYAARCFPAPPRRNEWAFRFGYVATLCGLLLVCGVLPATVFFRDAYQQAAQNFAKYVQWRFADDLVQRATRIRRDYADDPQTLSASAEKRLAVRWDIFDHAPASANSHATAEDSQSAPSMAGQFCSIDIVPDPATPAQPIGTARSVPTETICVPKVTDDHGATASREVSGNPVASLLVRPAVDDWFADLLPNLSADAATDEAWEWNGSAGHRFTVCERRLNDQIGAGTCTTPLRIGWGLVPSRFVSGSGEAPSTSWCGPSPVSNQSESDGFFSCENLIRTWNWIVSPLPLASSIAALFIFGLIWTIVRFLFVLDADANGQAERVSSEVPVAAPAAMWASMDDTQKLALAQTARYGIPNPKNGEAITALLRSGILVRRPQWAVASEALRTFVGTSKAQGDIDDLEKRIPPSDWSRWRGPLSVLIVCLAVFLFGVQRGLIDSAAALLTGLTGTIGAVTAAIARLSGMWNRGIWSLFSDSGSTEKKSDAGSS